jgi:hypothetical protein
MSWLAKLIGGLVIGAIAFGLVHGPSSSCWLSGWLAPPVLLAIGVPMVLRFARDKTARPPGVKLVV